MDRPRKGSRLAAAGFVALFFAFFTLGLPGSPALAKAPKPPKGAVKVKPANVVPIAKGVWCAKAPGKWKSYVPGKRLLIGKGKRKKTYFISALQQAKQARSAGKAKRFERTHRRYLKECRKIEPLRFNFKKAIGVARTQGKKGRDQGRSESPESNLQAILPSGALREAVASGWASVFGYWFAPNGNIFLSIQDVDLKNATYLPKEGGCGFIEVDRASGVPTCVDSDDLAVWEGPQSVQFDSLGNVFYAAFDREPGKPETVRGVLRRRSPNGEITQLSEGPTIQEFRVLPDDSVLAIGFEDCFPPFGVPIDNCSPSDAWLKRFASSPSGAEETLLTTDPVLDPQVLLTGLSLFPDGNVYFFFADQDPRYQNFPSTVPTNQRILRYLTKEKRIDPKPWISINPELSPQWALSSLCTPDATQARLWPCRREEGSFSDEAQLYWGQFAPTPSGEVFVAAAGAFYRAFPALSITRTNSSLAMVGISSTNPCITSVKNTVIYCGGNRLGQERGVVAALDLSTGTEKTLLGPERGLQPYQVGVTASGEKLIFVAGRSGGRVMGEIDLGTGEVSGLQDLKYDLLDFLIFGDGGAPN